MDHEPREEFAELRALLRLKRYEQPPPGFFSSLENQIRRRLTEPAPSGWTAFWERVSESLNFEVQLSPAMAMVFGGVLLVAMLSSAALKKAIPAPLELTFESPTPNAWGRTVEVPQPVVVAQPSYHWRAFPPSPLSRQTAHPSSMSPVAYPLYTVPNFDRGTQRASLATFTVGSR